MYVRGIKYTKDIGGGILAYKVTISDGTVMEKCIQHVSFNIDKPDDHSIGGVYPVNTMTIVGRIGMGEPTVGLYKWSLLPAGNPDCYKEVTVEQTHANQLIRKVRFSRAFVVDYSESYSKGEGAGLFTINIRQLAGLDIETTAQPVEKVQAVPDAGNLHEKVTESMEKVAAVSSTLALAKTGSLKRSFADRLAKMKETQDNGIISPVLTAVRFGEQFTQKEGKKALKPNVTYTTPEGYAYKTDELGRITSAVGILKIGSGKRNAYAQKTVGRDDRKIDDDGGHLIASIFKGSGDFDNLVPMNGNLNKGEWRKLENSWSSALKEKPPQQVKTKITPIYKGNSQRPNLFIVEYKVGDKPWNRKKFKNSPGGK